MVHIHSNSNTFNPLILHTKRTISHPPLINLIHPSQKYSTLFDFGARNIYEVPEKQNKTNKRYKERALPPSRFKDFYGKCNINIRANSRITPRYENTLFVYVYVCVYVYVVKEMHKKVTIGFFVFHFFLSSYIIIIIFCLCIIHHFQYLRVIFNRAIKTNE